jgi:rare lipoprotein A
MRPQFTLGARRAVAAAGAMALGAGITGTVANASVATPHARIANPRAPHRHRAHRRPPALLRVRLLHPNVLIGQDVAFLGRASPNGAHRTIAVQQLSHGRWVAIAHTSTDGHGYFIKRIWPRRLGREALRVRASGITTRHTFVSGRVATVFRQVIASWYGPGGTTACGQALGAATQGVANLTLPCGTLVTLHYGDRTVRVPVIDRGPFVPGRAYDLTYATKLALGAGDVSRIWASA